MIRRLWRWLTADTVVDQHREMVEADLWTRELLYQRYREERLAKHRLEQPSLLDLGKELGIYPQRTFITAKGGLAIPNDNADREELRQALRRQHT